MFFADSDDTYHISICRIRHLDVNAGIADIAGNMFVNECHVFLLFCFCGVGVGVVCFFNRTDCFMPSVYATMAQSNVHVLKYECFGCVWGGGVLCNECILCVVP